MRKWIRYANRRDLEHRAIVTDGGCRGLTVSVVSSAPGEPAYMADLLTSLREIKE